MFGERLQLARKKAGLSLRGLADAIGGQVTPQAIGKYERGEMMPSSTIMIALTKALGVSMEFLVAPLEVRLGALDFRKKSGTSARDRHHVEATVIEHVERYLLVEEVLELKSAAWSAPFAVCQHRRRCRAPSHSLARGMGPGSGPNSGRHRAVGREGHQGHAP